ncbi:MAG: hypothetical protein M3209_09950 [Acidobacteriota bacterium]|nr:hypothetical protein [Acidobacteriota bacterium]
MIKRIEIKAIERERIVIIPSRLYCSFCQNSSEHLTTAQTAAFAQVKTQSVCRWLARGRAASRL